MPSFGEKLKLEREKRKITLEQISGSTKIGTRMLQALEEDKFNQLPGGIFNKGFVRAYSRVVGLDEDQTVAEYLQASGDAASIQTEIAAQEDDERAREHAENVSRLDASAADPSRQLPWGVFAAVLLAVALALSLWSHRQRQHAKQSARPIPATSVAQPPAEHSSGQVRGQASDDSAGKAASGSTTTSSRTGGSAPYAAPKTSQNPAPAVPAATPGQFTVVIQAREDSWISITADGRTVSSELMAAGTERAVQGRKEVIVKSGNAGGTDFLFNGKKLDIGGEFGEVKLITFGPRGILPNAPEAPSTP
ncbi:MAG TPA: helix-turn-helix domain-containing protein [Terriglobales bacterium]|nr:helix-turn-helix domain-containing protein [Terriglobales bacterium]